MKISKNIYYLIGLAILIILINTLFFLHLVTLNKKHHTFATTSYEVIYSATILLSTIKDAETGQRGFIITNDKKYLNPFNDAKLKLDSIYQVFKNLVANRKYKTVNMERLRGLVVDRMTELNETVLLKFTGSESELQEIVLSDQGRASMQGIREQINNLIIEEKLILQKHESDVDRFSHRTKVYSVISNFILLIVAVFSLFTITDNRVRIKNLFKQIGDKNNLLEQQKGNLQDLSKDLIKQNGELERFAYVASHDLRAPAANLEALLNLYKEAKDNTERKSLVETMQDVTDNLSTKLNDLVELLRSKHEANLLNENLDFQEIYEKVIKNLSTEIQQTHANIDYDFSLAPTLNYPKSYLESILQNLISNALKYRHPERKPEIKIRSFKEKGKTHMVIADNGIGIDMIKHGSQLFGLYKTFQNHRNSKGIGLYITKAQIVSLGGNIEVESKLQEGTRFMISFNS
ncbi:MAG TPA: CHASE3 domain-containing protein [Sphingobacteriaceae bacterium]|nr:CHASE3 domain-containing protein [Sphingobacteriaceae bacterium]